MRKIKFLSQAEISENIYVEFRTDGIYALTHIGNNRVLWLVFLFLFILYLISIPEL